MSNKSILTNLKDFNKSLNEYYVFMAVMCKFYYFYY